MIDELKKVFSDQTSKVDKGNKYIEVKPIRIAFYVPTRKGNHEFMDELTDAKLRRAVMTFLVDSFGGATNYRTVGRYNDDEGVQHNEDVLVCESYATNDEVKENAEAIRDLANCLRIIFEQKSVAVVIDSEMVFFDPTDYYIETYEKIAKGINPGSKLGNSIDKLWEPYLKGALNDEVKKD